MLLLSPFLFILVAEGLTRITERAVHNGLLKGVGPTPASKVSIIQYADNTLFFCGAKRRQISNLLFIWNLFEWASGMKVNRQKTELFYLGRHARRGGTLADILGCKLGSLPTVYLGLPLSDKQLRKDDWGQVIGKFEKRIEGWQAKLLSQGGRLVLVNSVLSNLPLYYLSMFRAPKWVVRRLEALRRAFFWKGATAVGGGQCLVNWKTVCRSTEEGGLGVLNLENMNVALLAKWWWRFLSEKSLLWGAFLKGVYYGRRKPLREGISFRPLS